MNTTTATKTVIKGGSKAEVTIEVAAERVGFDRRLTGSTEVTWFGWTAENGVGRGYARTFSSRAAADHFVSAALIPHIEGWLAESAR